MGDRLCGGRDHGCGAQDSGSCTAEMRHPSVAGHKSVAVLYFNNLSQDQSLNWLDNGLTDMLTTNLAQVKGLDVLSTERVMSAVQRASKDGKSLDPAQAQSVARDAGADAYITGALLKIGPTQLRLDVRAQDTSTGQILFSDKLEGQDVQSIFGMVDRLTAKPCRQLFAGVRGCRKRRRRSSRLPPPTSRPIATTSWALTTTVAFSPPMPSANWRKRSVWTRSLPSPNCVFPSNTGLSAILSAAMSSPPR